MGRMRLKRAAAILLPVLASLATAWGCAQVEAPSGGPEDRSLPRVIGLSPDSGSTGVRPDTISILFGKAMDRASVRDWTFITPPVRIEAGRWEGERLDLILSTPPESGRTYTILFGAEVVDRRKNSLGPKTYPFSTAGTLDDGAAEGKVLSGTLRTGGSYLYAWAWGDSFSPEDEEIPPPIRMGQSSKDGQFRLSHLPRGVELRIGALYDAARNRSYEPEDDLWGFADRPVHLDDTTRAASGLEIYIVLDDEPGSLAGAVVDSSCAGAGSSTLRQLRRESDSLSVAIGRRGGMPAAGGLTDSLKGFARAPGAPVDTARVLARLGVLDSLRSIAAIDSVRCATLVIVRLLAADSSLAAESRGKGSFEFRDLAPGVYRIEAFRDLDADGKPGGVEPRGALPGQVTLLPGRKLPGLDFPIRLLP